MKDVSTISLKDNYEGIHLLANEIVVWAIKDWKSLVKGKSYGNCQENFDSLRQFFLSGWCDLLLHGTGFTGEFILEEMEKFKLEEENKLKKRKGKKNAKRRN